MKTDKFEKTIRRKLESISPDFQESDWSKMQNYMHVHTPPTFWQQYGSWIGYAAAASVTSVMAFMYIGQLSQNNHLVTDVKQLQNQIEIIKNQPVATSKADTIYIVQKEILNQTPRNERISVERRAGTSSIEARQNLAFIPENSAAENENTSAQTRTNQGVNLSEQPEVTTKPEKDISGDDRVAGNKPTVLNSPKIEVDGAEKQNKAGAGSSQTNLLYKDSQGNSGDGILANNGESSSVVPPVVNHFTGVKALDSRFDLKEQTPVQTNSFDSKINTALANRLSAKQVRKAWMASTAANYKNPLADKKTEQVAQAENVIPKLNLKVPYRFGAGIQSEGRAQGKTITGEVLVSKKFSISTGITWLKVKPVEFITETIFRDKNHRDFKQSHPNEVPRAFPILNIKVDPSLVQIPLTVAFRNEMKNDWAFFAGAGTNVIVKSKERISYDCIVPNPYNEFQSNAFERKMDVPVINSVNFSAGLEKTWHPIVIQAEGYLYTYFKPLTPLNQKTGPGFKVKLLYQIGRKM